MALLAEQLAECVTKVDVGDGGGELGEANYKRREGEVSEPQFLSGPSLVRADMLAERVLSLARLPVTERGRLQRCYYVRGL